MFPFSCRFFRPSDRLHWEGIEVDLYRKNKFNC